MRVIATSGDRRVDIQIDGDSPELLRTVERTAKRLLAVLPEPAPPEAEDQPFGFSLTAETERSDPPPLREHEADTNDEPPGEDRR